MKFVVTRTSDFEDPKCDEAFIAPFTRVDKRNVDDPMKNKYISADWYTLGTNHRVENGQICRDFQEECHFVEINSLEELLKFQEKYGAIIIRSSHGNDSVLEIEIYDNYRE